METQEKGWVLRNPAIVENLQRHTQKKSHSNKTRLFQPKQSSPLNVQRWHLCIPCPLAEDSTSL